MSVVRSAPIVAVSVHAAGADSGHTLVDDEVYFGFLVDAAVDFSFYTSAHSVHRIAVRYPKAKHRLKLLADPRNTLLHEFSRARSIDVPSGAYVLLLGFSEKFALALALANVFRRFQMTLVATNNFSVRRVRKFRGVLRLILLALQPWLKRIVVHSGYERTLVAGLVPTLADRVRVKKHHLMAPRRRPDPIAARDRPVVAFFGPVKHDKPITPLLALIKADRAGKLAYRVYNVDALTHQQLVDACSERPQDLEVTDQPLADEAYEAAVAFASLLILTHDAEFEGKLSGNLCDSVALQVPFLSDRREPATEFVRKYGPIGYLFDFSDPNWPALFLAQFDAERHAACRLALTKMSAHFAIDSIAKDFRLAIGLGGSA
jgi:hypothetical protein